jgi:hypothetical protein
MGVNLPIIEGQFSEIASEPSNSSQEELLPQPPVDDATSDSSLLSLAAPFSPRMENEDEEHSN